MSKIIQGGIEVTTNLEKYEEMEKWANTCRVWKKWIKPLLKDKGELIVVDFKTKQIMGRSTIIETVFSFDYKGEMEYTGKHAIIKELDGIYTLFFDDSDYDEKGRVFLEFRCANEELNQWQIRGLLVPFKFTFLMQSGLFLSKEILNDFLIEIGNLKGFL